MPGVMTVGHIVNQKWSKMQRLMQKKKKEKKQSFDSEIKVRVIK